MFRRPRTLAMARASYESRSAREGESEGLSPPPRPPCSRAETSATSGASDVGCAPEMNFSTHRQASKHCKIARSKQAGQYLCCFDYLASLLASQQTPLRKEHDVRRPWLFVRKRRVHTSQALPERGPPIGIAIHTSTIIHTWPECPTQADRRKKLISKLAHRTYRT